MKHKKSLIFLSLFLTLILVIFAIQSKFKNKDNFISRILIHLVDWNAYHVDVGESDDFKIVWRSEDTQRTIWDDRNNREKIPNTYGKNFFDIYYQTSLIGSVGHFKTNWWHVHEYFISIEQEEDGVIEISFEAKGPDYSSKQKNLSLSL